MRTSFGPEEGEKEALAIKAKSKVQKEITKVNLEKQIYEKSSEKKKNREIKLETDREEERENKYVLASTKKIVRDNKLREKEHWDSEIKKSKDLKSKLPHRDDTIIILK